MSDTANEIPMSHTFQSNKWETIDSMWAIGSAPGVFPKRYIWVRTPGFRIRKKIAFFGGKGIATPTCVDYGDVSSIVGNTIQMKANPGETVSFVQGTGECQGTDNS